MRQSIVYICDVCGFTDEKSEFVMKHEGACLKQQAREQEELLRRQATGQLTIGQILEKCDKLPNYLPVVILSDCEPKYHGAFPSDVDSYRGYYDELAIEIDHDNSMSLLTFMAMMKGSLNRSYSGYRGGDYSMYKDTFVWLSEYGSSSGIIVTDICLAPNKEIIHLYCTQVKD